MQPYHQLGDRERVADVAVAGDGEPFALKALTREESPAGRTECVGDARTARADAADATRQTIDQTPRFEPPERAPGTAGAGVGRRGCAPQPPRDLDPAGQPHISEEE